MPVIDIHFHVVPPEFLTEARRGGFADAVTVHRSADKENFVFHAPDGVAVEPETEVEPRSYEPALILAALDERGLTHAAMSPAPELFIYWTPPELGIRIARSLNDGMAALAATAPDRLIGLASLPMQAPEAAAAELRRAVDGLGLRGAAICTHVDGVDLDHPRFEPVFATAERLDVPIFLHPQNYGDMRRLADMHLWNVVGFPYETALCASRLVLSGLFEKFPRLNVVLAHGGGYFPYQIGRLDHAYAARSSLRQGLPKQPSAYLGNIFCDGLVHDRTSLRFLVDRLGADHVVLGCDYPFGMGTTEAADQVRALRLPAGEEAAILGGTLARLLKLPESERLAARDSMSVPV